MRLTLCPICKKGYLKVGLKNHIINSAKGELWRKHRKEGKELQHLDYYDTNLKLIKIKTLTITNNMKNKYCETSVIKCPNCEKQMELIKIGTKKIGTCKNCGYKEPNYK